jgi:hypothetical protein
VTAAQAKCCDNEEDDANWNKGLLSCDSNGEEGNADYQEHKMSVAHFGSNLELGLKSASNLADALGF